MKEFRLFQSVRFTKGIKNFILSDNDSNCYYSFPLESKKIIPEQFNDEFKQLLIDQGMAYYETDETNMSTLEEPIYANQIDNLIFEVGHIQRFDLKSLLNQIRQNAIRSIEIRFLESNPKLLLEVLELLKDKNIQYLIIFISYSEELHRFLNEFTNALQIIDRLVIHSVGTIKVNLNEFLRSRVLLHEDHLSNLSCGKISAGNFLVNTPLYLEARHHNSCLNRKISIDAKGNIKNCPSMKKIFGNLSDTTLAEAIENPGFKKYWNITKDDINVCKDCEFRYICTDCRAYVEDPKDMLSKPLKCGYNPYTGEWNEWSKNPLKQKAIDFYGMREMVENID